MSDLVGNPEDRFSYNEARIIFLVCTVKPVMRDHIKQDIFLAFQTGGCLLLHESSAESSALLSFNNKQPPVFNCNSKISSVYLSVAVQPGL